MEGNRKPRGTVYGTFEAYKTEVKARMDRRETRALNKVEGEDHLEIGELKRRDWNENVIVRPEGLREDAETAISCRGPGPARKKTRYTSSREKEEVAQICPCG